MFPSFRTFSWFSMMFGAGIGVGMLTWAVAEPVYHFSNNPEVIQGITNGGTADNIRMAYKWSFLHWGLGAWACYAIAGLSLGYFSYRRGLPLTMRSSLTPCLATSSPAPPVTSLTSSLLLQRFWVLHKRLALALSSLSPA